MTTLPLAETAVVTLDANGAGSARLSPKGARTWWEVERITFAGNSELVPTVTVNLDHEFVAGSVDANQDEGISTPALVVPPGRSIALAWSEGSPGARMTATLRGRLVAR